MKIHAEAPLLAVLILLCSTFDAYGQQKKLAQTGMKFLSLSVDARSAAMGDAVTAVESGATALFYNPATMAHQDRFLNLALAQTQWIVGIDYNLAGISFRPAGGRFGVFGFSAMSVDYGTVQGTMRVDTDQGFIDTEDISPRASSFGVGYANALTDRFSVGGHVKLAHQNLGNSVMRLDGSGNPEYEGVKQTVMAYDFGVLYKTGFRSLNFAVGARNFAREIKYGEESFQLPLTLKIGLSMDMMDLTQLGSQHSFLLAVEAEHPRDFPEQIRVGGEYVFMNLLALRAGYVFPADEQGINAGVGLRQRIGGMGFGVDYAYSDYGIFNTFSKVHRVALQLTL
jgi:hypothetical protein